MDEELENAAIGNTTSSASQFMRDAVKSKPIEYFQSVHRARHSQDTGGNIFHLAAYHNNVDFFNAALDELPEEVVHSLLCGEEATRVGGKKRWPCKYRNPIHTAAQRGSDLVVRILIEFYRRDERTVEWPTWLHHKPWRRRMPEHLDLEPWLAQDRSTGRTPLHHALKGGHESLSLEILSLIGVQSVSALEDANGQSILFLAVKRGLNRVADLILNSAAPYSLRGHHDSTALFFAPNCSGNIVFFISPYYLFFWLYFNGKFCNPLILFRFISICLAYKYVHN